MQNLGSKQPQSIYIVPYQLTYSVWQENFSLEISRNISDLNVRSKYISKIFLSL